MKPGQVLVNLCRFLRDDYIAIASVIAVPVFLGGLGFAVCGNGVAAGLTAGWLPSLVAAFVVGGLWPLVYVAAVVLYVVALNGMDATKAVLGRVGGR